MADHAREETPQPESVLFTAEATMPPALSSTQLTPQDLDPRR